MNRHEIVEYYEEEIEKIENYDIEKELSDKLWQAYDLLHDIEKKIEEIEDSKNELPYYEPRKLCDEFNQTERMC